MFLILLALMHLALVCQGCQQQVDENVEAELEARLAGQLHGTAEAEGVHYDPDTKRITADRIALSSDDGRVRYEGGSLGLTATPSNKKAPPSNVTLRGGTLHLHVDTDADADWLRQPVRLEDVQLSVKVDDGALQKVHVTRATLEQTGRGLQFELAGSDATLHSSEMAADRLTAVGMLEPGLLTLDSLELSVEGATANARDLLIDMPSGRLRSGVVRGSLPLALLAKLATPGIPPMRGTATLETGAVFNADGLALPTTFSLHDAHVAGHALWPSATGKLTPTATTYILELRPNPESAQRVTLSLARGTAPPASSAKNAPFEVPVAFDTLSVPAQAPLLKMLATTESTLSGRCAVSFGAGPQQAKGSCEGMLTAPALATAGLDLNAPALGLAGSFALTEADLRMTDIRVSLPEGGTLHGHPLHRASASLPTLDQPVRVLDVRAEGPGLSLSADKLTTLTGEGKPMVVGKLLVKELPLRLLGPLFAEAVSQPLAIEGQARGSIEVSAKGETPFVVLDLDLQRVGLLGATFESGHLRLSRAIGGRDTTLDLLALRQPDDGKLELRGSFAAGTSDLQLSAENVLVDSPLDGRPTRVTAHGHLGQAARVTGTLAQTPNGSSGAEKLSFDLNSGAARGTKDTCPDDPTGAASTGHYRLCATSADGSLSLALGARSLLKGGPVRGQARLVKRNVWPTMGEVAGRLLISGQATLEADSLAHLSRAKGELNMEALVLQVKGETLTLESPQRLSIKRGQAVLDDVRLSGPLGLLQLSGTLGADAANISGTAKLSAERLAQHIPSIARASGTVRATVTVDDKLQVRAQFEDLTLHPVGSPTLTEARGTATWANHDLYLSQVTAHVAGGEVRVDGRISASDGTALTVEADDLTWAPKDRLSVGLNAKGTLTRKPDEALPLLTMDVSLHDLSYGRRIQFPEVVMAAKDATSGPPEQANLRLSLNITQDGPWHIDNGVLDVAVKSPQGLRVRGTDSAFGVLGTLTVDEGRIQFYNDSFNLSPSTLTFKDARRLSVAFDLSGQAAAKQRKGATIALSAKGDDRGFALQVKCKASDSAPVPPRFRCKFDGQALTCPDYKALVALWTCSPPR